MILHTDDIRIDLLNPIEEPSLYGPLQAMDTDGYNPHRYFPNLIMCIIRHRAIAPNFGKPKVLQSFSESRRNACNRQSP